MAGMRARTVPAEGPAAVLGQSSAEELAALAGSRLAEALPDGTAVFLTGDGHRVTAYPGWVVIRPDGAGEDGAVLCAPDQAEILTA